MLFPLKEPADFRNHPDISLAFGIARVKNDPKQRHVVLIYRQRNQELAQIHMGWHLDVRHELWSEEYHWVSFESLDIETQETLADFAVIVATNAARNKNIPYSIIFSPGPHFDPSGNYLGASDDGSGLSCATFLLSICDDFGLPLIDCSSWPVRQADLSRLQLLLKYLRQTFVRLRLASTPVDIQEAHLHKVPRFRPEEVFVTAHLYDGVPLKFNEVYPYGEFVVELLPVR